MFEHEDYLAAVGAAEQPVIVDHELDAGIFLGEIFKIFGNVVVVFHATNIANYAIKIARLRTDHFAWRAQNEAGNHYAERNSWGKVDGQPLGSAQQLPLP